MKIIRKRKNKAGKLEMWVEEYMYALTAPNKRCVWGGMGRNCTKSSEI